MLALYILSQNTCIHYKGDSNDIGELRLVHNGGENFGAIQVCIYVYNFLEKCMAGDTYQAMWSGQKELLDWLVYRQLNLGYLSKRFTILPLNSITIYIYTCMQMLHQEIWSCLAMYT